MTPAVPQERAIEVGLGELHVTDDVDAVLVARGLGSCVAVCAYDPKRTIGAMAHTVLPQRGHRKSTGGSAKFVDEGIPLLLERMEQLGATRSRIIVKIVGGSQVIAPLGLNTTTPSIGKQNAQAAKAVLASLGLRLRGNDTGGHQGRTARLHVGSGELVVSTIRGSSYELKADADSRSESKGRGRKEAAKLARILMADDSAYVRARTVALLKEFGYEAMEASDGAQAVEVFKRTRPDAVLLDITMPVMDGLEALRQILALDPKAKVAMVTAAGQQTIVAEAIKIGACDFVVKPFHTERLKATLDMLVS